MRPAGSTCTRTVITTTTTNTAWLISAMLITDSVMVTAMATVTDTASSLTTATVSAVASWADLATADTETTTVGGDLPEATKGLDTQSASRPGATP